MNKHNFIEIKNNGKLIPLVGKLIPGIQNYYTTKLITL
jgi:hypothetical protein